MKLQLKAFEKLVIGYLFIICIIATVFQHRLDNWLNIVLSYLGLIALILIVNKIPAKFKWLAFLKDWYLFPFILLLYNDLGSLNGVILGQKNFNELIINLEQSIFGSQPSTWLAEYFDSRVLTELMNVGYFSYYLLIPVIGLSLYYRTDKSAFYHFAYGVMLIFLSCYLIYIVMPVEGPCYIFPQADVNLLKGYWLTDLTVLMHHGGAVSSCAFPSSHAAAAIVMLMFARRYHRRLFKILTPFVIFLVLGTFYGKFHFVVDAIAGTLFGFFIYWIASLYQPNEFSKMPLVGQRN